MYSFEPTDEQKMLIDTVACGNGRVIFSPLDLTTGMLGASTFLNLGYQPESARAIVRNTILWAWDGAPAEAR